MHAMEPQTPHQAAATRLRNLLAERGIRDERVLTAIERLPRERFVDRRLQAVAYEDRALAIESGQTISQPYVVARMTELLELTGTPGERVLEIGTGSGYQTGVLAQLAAGVVSIERIPSLSQQAEKLLAELGFSHVQFHVSDGSLGWPASAPYDAIIVTAAAPHVSPVLYEQLKPGGRMVVPVGSEQNQVMQQVVRGAQGPVVTEDFSCRFVPLIGAEAWSKDGSRGWQ